MNNNLPTVDPDVLRRGGDGLHGIYMGSAPLNRKYTSTKPNTYRATTQLRTYKSSSLNESTLNKQFDRKLEVDNDAATVNQLNKEEFLEAVKNVIKCYWLQSFFYLPNSHDEMTYIVDELHAFDVDMILNEHLSRMNDPKPIKATDARGFDVKTEASQLARFCC